MKNLKKEKFDKFDKHHDYNYILLIISLITLFLASILSINLSSATVSRGDPFFNLSQSGFAEGSVLDGIVNFSLNNHPADSKMIATITYGTKSIVKEMLLVDFLRNASATFDCSQDCLVNYSAIPGTSSPTKTLNLNNGAVRYFGLVATGTSVQIQNLTFTLSGSGNTESVCYETPFKMDVLDDGVNDFEYREATSDLCGNPKLSDCFVMEGTQDTFFTRGLPYCELIDINKTGRLKVDAYLKYWGEGYNGGEYPSGGDIKFTVYNKDRVLLGNCSIDGTANTEYSFDDNTCNIGEEEEDSRFYISKKDDYIVCVAIVSSAAPSYSIKAEMQPELCGFQGDPVQNPAYIADFAIRAQEMKFAAFNSDEVFDNSTRLGGSLISYLQDYVTTRYQGNCSGGCVLPIKIISTADQVVEMRDITFSFLNPLQTFNNYFYDINIVSPKINMTKQALPFRAMNVTAPEASDSLYHITLNLSGVLSQIINFRVGSVPVVQNVTPLNVAPNVNTVFHVTVQNVGSPIVSYVWGWDGNPGETTNVSEATHSYSAGTHTLVIRVTDASGLTATGTFTVNASLSVETINQTFMQKKNAYSNIGQFSSLWYKDMIYNESQITSVLAYVGSQLSNPSANLNELNTQINTLKIPIAINDSLTFQESEYFPDIDQIDLSHLSDLGAGFYDPVSDEAYKNAIGVWQETLDLRMGGSNKKITFDDGTIQDISLLTIRVSPTNSENIYFVLKMPYGVTRQQIRNQENLQFHEFSDALGLSLTQSQVITLAFPVSQQFSQVVFYASPDFSTLNVNQGGNNGGGTGETSIVLPIIIAVVIFIAVIIVLILIWKGRKSSKSEGFELGQGFGNPGMSGGSSLFANPDDVLGLTSYIQSSLAEGKNKSIIEKELLESGWTKEQIKEGFKQVGM